MTGAELADELSVIADAYCSDARVAWQLARYVNANMAAILAALRSERPASDMQGAMELAAREKMREFITAMADEYVRDYFSCDPSTGVWETRSEAKQSYEEGLRDAANAIARLNCEKFGHDWWWWNDITRRCNRCEVQEHGEHLRAALAAAHEGCDEP